MAYNSKAKIKVLFLKQILEEETDAEHGLSMSQIIERLDAYGVTAERKSIYDDIRALREFGVDIQTYQRNPVEYAIVRRDFSFGELTLMVDAIESCRAITDKQARMLVTNILQLASNREQGLLRSRRIHVKGRIKSKSECVLDTVDKVHLAINTRCKLGFSYQKRGVDGALVKDKRHEVTPVGISYEDGFYYLSAWSAEHGNISSFRLDRMSYVHVLKGLRAERNEAINHFRYEDELGGKAVAFGQFGGKELTATLSVDPEKVEIVTDRFGEAAAFEKFVGAEARYRVKLCQSEQFFGWVASMGKKVRIVAPKSLVSDYRAYLQFLLDD